ncbi:Uncharacterized protein HZ326_11314 [Fusarium oxysporum f. sp. albedinis]|nr:Uncharacterized protein HZ326_11314 [Fusarium oxysporum f. sp. albedinis]
MNRPTFPPRASPTLSKTVDRPKPNGSIFSASPRGIQGSGGTLTLALPLRIKILSSFFCCHGGIARHGTSRRGAFRCYRGAPFPRPSRSSLRDISLRIN